jgi:DNA-binding IclR family transcriptional regulator
MPLTDEKGERSPAERTPVQVVERVASILATLRGEPDGLSLSEIAARVGLSRSTVHRLITALEHERFVSVASPAGGFRLGPALASLAMAASRHFVLTVHPYLASLSRELNETVDLAVLEHDRVLFVDQVAANTQRLRAVSAVGAVFPAHCTANGKALLAGLSNAEVERLLPARLERLTPRTTTSRTQLLAELETVQRDAVAYDREEHTEGICAVGVAIAPPDAPVAAISVPLPAQRFFGNEKALAAALLRTGASLEQEFRGLGFMPDGAGAGRPRSEGLAGAPRSRLKGTR